MPGFIGRKICTELVFIKPNYPKYKEVAERIRNIYNEYDDQSESLGLDEVDIDVTAYLKDNGLNSFDGKIFLGEKIRAQVFEATKLTCSGGIAPNRLLAKICSDVNKPNGLTYLENSVKEIYAFLKDQPVRKLPGIGKINELILSGIGIENCGDVLSNCNEIYINFSPNAF